MIEARHTPGNWIAAPRSSIVGRPIVSAPQGRSICNVTEHDDAEANARLIAAAPELLAALKGLIPDNVSLDNPNIRDRHVLAVDVEIGELRTAAAAIAKAEGRS